MTSLRDLTRVFARIGCLSFGGPAAQIGLMEEELVTRRPWLTQDEFLRALSFCMLLPGPEAMQLATYAGWRLRGVAGGLIAGGLFVIPGALVISVLAALYIQYGQLPAVRDAFLGVQAAVVIVVVQALLRLRAKALATREDLAIAVVAFVSLFTGALPFPVVILGAGLIGALRASEDRPSAPPPERARTPWGTLATWGASFAALVTLSGPFLRELTLYFTALALLTFGGAYAVLSWMTQTVVQDYGWITTPQMIDALGLAETTPGPLILVTQFVGILAGYAAGGWSLALAAGLVTLWVTFLPCFVFIFAGAPWIDRLSAMPRLAAALRRITAAVVGVIASLSLWFALHVVFADVGTGGPGWLDVPIPAPSTLRAQALVLIALAAVLALRLKSPLPLSLLICAAAGLGLGAVV
ncbi:MAG: chromate efflux transporter [Shimia sp.]